MLTAIFNAMRMTWQMSWMLCQLLFMIQPDVFWTFGSQQSKNDSKLSSTNVLKGCKGLEENTCIFFHFSQICVPHLEGRGRPRPRTRTLQVRGRILCNVVCAIRAYFVLIYKMKVITVNSLLLLVLAGTSCLANRNLLQSNCSISPGPVPDECSGILSGNFGNQWDDDESK